MTRASVIEYVEAIRERYYRGNKRNKGWILDEAVRVTGYHRKALIRLLRRRGETTRLGSGRRGRPRQYGSEVAEALRVLWEATDHICSRRLQPFVPQLLQVLKRHCQLSISPEVQAQLLAMSPATIDRLLRPFRTSAGRRRFSTTKPGSLLKASIPIRTFADWDQEQPGFLEVDLVAHCGESTEGFYLHTLTAVDIATGWVECQAVWGKGQACQSTNPIPAPGPGLR